MLWRAGLILLALTRPLAAEPVDVELVLAVDVSRSMDAREQQVQRDGYVAAFRDPVVVAEILSGLHGTIAVSYLEWGGPFETAVVVDWMRIGSMAEAEEFAAALAAQPITFGSSTSISSALRLGQEMIVGNRYDGVRRVIDISGDGPNNTGPRVDEARDAVVAAGIGINGLPVMINPAQGAFTLPGLDAYYAACVIGGAGAFVMPVRSVDAFAVTIRRKILLEVARRPAPAGTLLQVQATAPVDCGIGEAMRRNWKVIRPAPSGR
ncbi:MAG: DUF1194 domain-containing protein [Pseudomonadota bacterium]